MIIRRHRLGTVSRHFYRRIFHQSVPPPFFLCFGSKLEKKIRRDIRCAQVSMTPSDTEFMPLRILDPQLSF
jgi:hypothetical protein